LIVNGVIVAAKGADVYGRLAESKTSGTFTGRSELQLELTRIVINGQTVLLVTGEYELKESREGKARQRERWAVRRWEA
jgi:hypothetical protein